MPEPGSEKPLHDTGTEEPEAEAVAVALPGDADFVSASGISGARY